MRHCTLRQLEIFEAIARLNSFTRAAEELFLTQPTVSMQIKKLTDDIGLPLFEQIGKKI
ncbi:LysR family transcriptional regulator, partial [Nitrosomonas halophila]